jgi:hypothetical protein
MRDFFLNKIVGVLFHTSSLLHPLAKIMKGQRISRSSRLFLQEFLSSGFQTIHEGFAM